MHYQPAVDDSLFIAFEVLYAHQQLARVPAFVEVDQALMTQVLNEAGKFVADVVAPLQVVGDSIGCRFDQGQVITPPGFRSAYQAFWQAGWPALSSAPEDGGQGLPTLLEAVLYEMLSAANHGWTMAPGLLHGAYECLKHHASDDLKARYLSKLATGIWDWRARVQRRRKMAATASRALRSSSRAASMTCPTTSSTWCSLACPMRLLAPRV